MSTMLSNDKYESILRTGVELGVNVAQRCANGDPQIQEVTRLIETLASDEYLSAHASDGEESLRPYRHDAIERQKSGRDGSTRERDGAFTHVVHQVSTDMNCRNYPDLILRHILGTLFSEKFDGHWKRGEYLEAAKLFFNNLAGGTMSTLLGRAFETGIGKAVGAESLEALYKSIGGKVPAVAVAVGTLAYFVHLIVFSDGSKNDRQRLSLHMVEGVVISVISALAPTMITLAAGHVVNQVVNEYSVRSNNGQSLLVAVPKALTTVFLGLPVIADIRFLFESPSTPTEEVERVTNLRERMPVTFILHGAFQCGINYDLVSNPVVLNGRIYSRAAIEDWVQRKGTCPLSRNRVFEAQLEIQEPPERYMAAYRRYLDRLEAILTRAEK